MSSLEENKEIVRRSSREVWSKGNLDAVDELYGESYVNHNGLPFIPPGPEGVKQMCQLLRGAFPDLVVTTEELIAEGDKVVERWSGTATSSGEFLGIPRGEAVTMTGIIYRIEDGKIVERRSEADQLSLMQQLGVVPRPDVPHPRHVRH